MTLSVICLNVKIRRVGLQVKWYLAHIIVEIQTNSAFPSNFTTFPKAFPVFHKIPSLSQALKVALANSVTFIGLP